MAFIEKIAPGEQFVDCGANVGAYTLVAAMRGAHVVAIEPAWPNHDRLRRNLTLNSIKDGIRNRSLLEQGVVCPVVLGAAGGWRWLHYIDLHPGTAGHVITEDGEYSGDQSFHREPLPLVQLDALLMAFPYEARWIKVDVDGGEIDVLRGAELAMTDGKTKGWMIEVNIEQTETQVMKIMTDTGWKLLGRYDQRGGKSIGNIAYLEFGR